MIPTSKRSLTLKRTKQPAQAHAAFKLKAGFTWPPPPPPPPLPLPVIFSLLNITNNEHIQKLELANPFERDLEWCLLSINTTAQ
jgi:hypothetical protein